MRVQHQPRRIDLRLGPCLARRDRIGIAVESVDRRATFEQRTRITAGAEGGVDHDIAGLRIERGDHFVQQDGNVRGTGHLPLAFTSARKLAQAAFAPAQSSPIWASSTGFHSVKNRPPPWK